jgi:ligand-binding sensor protein
MSDTFNDGDPIDATLLQKLKTDVARATALAGRNVSAGSTINVGDLANQNPADISPPSFFGGITGRQKVTKGKVTTYTIDYSGAKFSGKPSSIQLTAVCKSGFADIQEPSIVSGSVSEKTAKVQIYGSGSDKDISIYFLAIKN